MSRRRNFKNKNYFELKENTTNQNLWDVVKAVLRGKFRTLNSYIRKEKRSKINNLNFLLKKEKEKQIKPKVSERKEIIRIRAGFPSVVQWVKNLTAAAQSAGEGWA